MPPSPRPTLPSLVLLALLAASLTAGCVGQHAYSLVWIHGEERLEPEPDRHEACSYLLDHEVRPEEQVLRYDQTTYSLDESGIDRVIAFDVFRSPSDCPMVYRLHPGASIASASLGHYGLLEVSFEENGTVNVDDRRFLEPGEEATFAYSEPADGDDRPRWYNGTIHVEHFEGWPRSGLQAEDV